MSHADTYVRGLYAELAPVYPLPKCLKILTDDVLNNFGIAWCFGLDADGCGLLSFDEGYLPTKHTVLHEFGHLVHAYVQRFIKWDVVNDFWLAMGFTTSLEGATAESNRLAALGQQYPAWQHNPSEVFADCFAYAILGDWTQTQTFGATDIRLRADTFFRELKEEDMALTESDKAFIQDTVQTAVNSRVGTAEVNILREVLGKLNSGFNTTVSTFIDRQSAGDKKVATAPVDL